MPDTPKILRHAKHLKSNVVRESGYPKIPMPGQLQYGEIAINYAEGLETISLKNSNNQITTFKPNTNVYARNFTSPISSATVCEVLSVGTVYNYQNFNLSFLDACDEDFDLFDIIDHIRTNFYDVCDLHITLNVIKSNDSDERHTSFYINSEAMRNIMKGGDTDLNTLSTVIGFYKHDEYFIAGDSSAMNGIEINWDKTTKVMTVRFVYTDSAYRMDGNDIN